MSPNNVMAIKREMPESTGLRDEFKATTVRNLKTFVQQASQKLVAEIDNLHVSQIPIAMGIAIDKIQSLQDQPTAVVEHRFSITHDTINKLLKEKGEGLKRAKEGAGTSTAHSQPAPANPWWSCTPRTDWRQRPPCRVPE